MAIKSSTRKKDNLATKKVWHRVKAPSPWKPKPGDELIGTYLTSEMRNGDFGEYKIHLIKSRNGKIYYVSGAMTNDLFALVKQDMKIKLVFIGKQVSQEGREYKVFELYTEEVIEFKLINTA